MVAGGDDRRSYHGDPFPGQRGERVPASPGLAALLHHHSPDVLLALLENPALDETQLCLLLDRKDLPAVPQGFSQELFEHRFAVCRFNMSRSGIGENFETFDRLDLFAEDKAEIEAVVARRRGPLGDVYELERDLTGRHGSIMHYNNNAKTQ